MTDIEVIESLNNAWMALAGKYQSSPNEGIRCGMNLLSKIISKVETEVKDSHRERQITTDEWLSMLEKG